MIEFFVLDVLLRQVVAVSSDPAPDSACAPSFLGRSLGQLPAPIVCCPLPGRQENTVGTVPLLWPLTRLSLGTTMVIAQPAPFVRAFVDAVDEAIRTQSPSWTRPHHCGHMWELAVPHLPSRMTDFKGLARDQLYTSI